MKTLLPLLSLLIFASCGVQKQILKDRIASDSLRIQVQQKEIKTKDSTIAQLNRKVEESSEESVVFKDNCDTVALKRILTEGKCDPAIVDSVMKAIGEQRNEIQILADGSKVFKGQIKEYRHKTSKLLEENYSLKSEKERLERENTYLKTHVKTQIETKNTTIVRYKLPIPLLGLIAIMIVVSLYFYYRSKRPKLF
ncbi:MAG: hypothetical protein [Podoviridae sp. ctrTa16]|nr:MAG: hypothetical protein [Podoviridae sp. ctrTa16]